MKLPNTVLLNYCQISFLLFSANDFIEAVADVIFKPFENVSCAEVPIVDDETQELPEQFSVGFGGPSIPGVVRGTVSTSTVTIIDDDEPGPGNECTVNSL